MHHASLFCTFLFSGFKLKCWPLVAVTVSSRPNKHNSLTGSSTRRELLLPLFAAGVNSVKPMTPLLCAWFWGRELLWQSFWVKTGGRRNWCGAGSVTDKTDWLLNHSNHLNIFKWIFTKWVSKLIKIRAVYFNWYELNAWYLHVFAGTDSLILHFMNLYFKL